MTSKTRANYEKAKSLRESDLSLAKIGERLGVSKQYVAKILKSPPSESSTKASTTASTDSVNQLTVRQRRFAKGLAEGKTQKQAAIEAVPPELQRTMPWSNGEAGPSGTRSFRRDSKRYWQRMASPSPT